MAAGKKGLRPGKRFRVWRHQIARNSYAHFALILSAVVIVFDQLTKFLVLRNDTLAGPLCSPTNPRYCGQIEISQIFDLTMVWNRGVSFGLFAGGMTSRIGLSILQVGVSIALIYWLASLKRRVAALGVGLIIGGALGNAYDRIVYGAVVDFLDFSGLYFPWVFNIADSAINVGVICLLYDAFFVTPRLERDKAAGK